MRAIIKLTVAEKKELQKLKKREENKKIYRRYMYLELSSAGMTNLKIAEVLGVCNDTLTDWRILFLEEGLEGLSKLHYEGRRESKLLPLKGKILKEIERSNVSTLKKLQSFLKKECSLEVEQSWLSRFCKKNSICLTKKQD